MGALTVIPIPPHPEDDPAFLAQAERLIAGAVAIHKPSEVYCVRIDNWFGSKWRRFAFSLWSAGFTSTTDDPTRLSVPPFNPSRVVREHYFVRHETARRYGEEIAPQRLHVHQPGRVNDRRTLARVVPGACLFWFSGRSRANGRGSVMAYVPTGDELATWYVELTRERGWDATTLEGIGPEELRALLEEGNDATSR